jgi:hypothetical protein
MPCSREDRRVQSKELTGLKDDLRALLDVLARTEARGSLDFDTLARIAKARSLIGLGLKLVEDFALRGKPRGR